MRITGNADIDGSTIALDQGANKTTVTSNSPSGDITVTLPATTDTLVGKATTDTLTNKTITAPVIAVDDDELSIKSNSDGTAIAKFDATGITGSTTRTLVIPDANTTIVGTDVTQTLTNKTLTSPVIATISNSGTVTLPTGAETLVGRATTDTLTNKTLTSPVIATISNSGDLTLPTGADTLVARTSTDTLTNKTLTAPVVGTTLTMDDQAEIRFEDDTGDEYVAIKATAGTTTHTYNLPTTQGAVSEVLGNDGSGNLSWMAALTSALNDNYTFIGNSSNVSTAVDTGSVGEILADTVTGLTIKASTTLTTPDIGVATATSVNKVAITAPATSSTITVADGKTLTASNTLTLTGTDTSSIAFGAGGTAAYTGDKLSAFSATTSAELAGVISDETGTGVLVLGTGPTLSAPVISTISNTGVLTLPTSTDTLVGKATTDILTNKTLTTPLIGTINEVTSTEGVHVKGATDGVAIPAGYMGEVLEATDSTIRSQAAASDDTYYDLSSTITKELTAGVWLINLHAVLDFIGAGMATGSNQEITLAIREGSNVIAETTKKLVSDGATTFNDRGFPMTISTAVNINASKTYKLSLKRKYGGGTGETGSVTIRARNDFADGFIRGIRIG